jgi:hypothetical protein
MEYRVKTPDGRTLAVENRIGEVHSWLAARL